MSIKQRTLNRIFPDFIIEESKNYYEVVIIWTYSSLLTSGLISMSNAFFCWKENYDICFACVVATLPLNSIFTCRIFMLKSHSCICIQQ